MSVYEYYGISGSLMGPFSMSMVGTISCLDDANGKLSGDSAAR
jgi:hypothetical protein